MADARDRPLTPRQARFCAEYMIDLNGEQAAIRAGYLPRSARVHASRMLTKANIQAELARLQSERQQRTEITADRVLAELAKLGFANMRDYVRAAPSGEPYPDFTDLTADQWAAVRKIRVEQYVEGFGDEARDIKRVTFELADKRAALVDIGRHIGMFAQRHELTAAGGAPLVTDTSRIALVLLNLWARHEQPGNDDAEPAAPPGTATAAR